MIDVIDLNSKLATITGLENYTVRAKNGANLPYTVITFNASDNFGADNKTFFKVDNAAVELYTTNKDVALEGKIEKIFNDNDMFFDTDETRDDDQQFYIKYYYLRG